jgi:hypothetical protein
MRAHGIRASQFQANKESLGEAPSREAESSRHQNVTVPKFQSDSGIDFPSVQT